MIQILTLNFRATIWMKMCKKVRLFQCLLMNE